MEGVDYFDSYSPAAKPVTVRTVLVLSTLKYWPLHQLNMNNSFLRGYLHEEVYLKPPQGYSKIQQGHVCKLKKSLYGLEQASREWN